MTKQSKGWYRDTYDPTIFSERFEEEIKDILPFEIPYKIKFFAIRIS